MLAAGQRQRPSRLRHACGPGTTSTRSWAATKGRSSRAGWRSRPGPRRPSAVRIGLMVGANTFRNPALAAKMATTLDHITAAGRSSGSALRGSRPSTSRSVSSSATARPERLRWLARRCPSCAGCSTASGRAPRPHYAIEGRPQRPAAAPGRGCPCSSVAAESRSRSGWSPATPMRTTSAASVAAFDVRSRSCATLRGHRARPARDRATTGIGPWSSATRARRPRASTRDLEHNGQARPWDDQRGGDPGGRGRHSRRSSRSATGTSSPASRAVRRGVDDPAGHGGPSAARARIDRSPRVLGLRGTSG